MTDNKFRLAPSVVCRRTSGDLKMLFNRDKGVMYELNESASAIIDIIDSKPASTKEICMALADDFDGKDEDIQRDVEALLADFVEAKLVIDGK